MNNYRYRYHRDILALYKRAFAALKAGCKVRLYWNGEPMDLAGWRAEFAKALHRRISGPQPLYRKLKPEWQTGMRRDRQRLQDIRRRIRVYQFETPEMRKRFGHLLSTYED